MCERDIDEKHVYSRLTHIFVSQADSTCQTIRLHIIIVIFLLFRSLSLPFFILFRFLCLFIYTCCNWKEDASFLLLLSSQHDFKMCSKRAFLVFFTARTIANAELKGKEKGKQQRQPERRLKKSTLMRSRHGKLNTLTAG